MPELANRGRPYTARTATLCPTTTTAVHRATRTPTCTYRRKLVREARARLRVAVRRAALTVYTRWGVLARTADPEHIVPLGASRGSNPQLAAMSVALP
jgi:hypothetical protein